MSKKFYTPIDMQLQQVLNQLLQNLASDPSAKESQIYYNSASHTIHFHNGTAWVQLGTLDQISAALAAVSLNNQNITNLADPVNPQDAVNLRTLQTMITALSDRAEVAYATAAALPANTYANGSAGVGATLTASTNGALSVDSANVITGQRVLVKNESSAANNGIYTVAQAGSASTPWVLTRATDMDQASELGPGILVPVESPSGATAGAVNNGVVFLSLAPSPFTVGTSAISFSTVGSVYSAGNGLTLSGTQFSLSAPVSVANGGTGATTAAAARANLVASGLYAATIGDGSTLSFSVTHNLNNSYPDVALYLISTGEEIEADVVSAGANAVTISSAVAFPNNGVKAVVEG